MDCLLNLSRCYFAYLPFVISCLLRPVRYKFIFSNGDKVGRYQNGNFSDLD